MSSKIETLIRRQYDTQAVIKKFLFISEISMTDSQRAALQYDLRTASEDDPYEVFLTLKLNGPQLCRHISRLMAEQYDDLFTVEQFIKNYVKTKSQNNKRVIKWLDAEGEFQYSTVLANTPADLFREAYNQVKKWWLDKIGSCGECMSDVQWADYYRFGRVRTDIPVSQTETVLHRWYSEIVSFHSAADKEIKVLFETNVLSNTELRAMGVM